MKYPNTYGGNNTGDKERLKRRWLRFLLLVIGLQIVLGIGLILQDRLARRAESQDGDAPSFNTNETVSEDTIGTIQAESGQQEAALMATSEAFSDTAFGPSLESASETAQEITLMNESEIASEVAVPEEIKEPSITLVMVGDILLHTPIEKASKQEDGSFDYAPLFAHTKDMIAGADIALVNQEVILGGEQLGISGYPAFNAPFEVGDALVETGFDVILHATNHALDKGKRGLLNCMEFWNTSYPEIGVLGIHDNAEDQEDIYVYEQDGICVAILNYTYGTNGIDLPEDMPFGVDYLKESRVREDIRRAKEISDFVIVCPHWGTEYSLKPDSSQKKWAKVFLEEGVNLVIGTHPHVIEPIEWMELEKSSESIPSAAEEGDSEGSEIRKCGMLVYYSLGNYVNWTSGKGDAVSNRMVGGMATVTLEKDDEDQVYIKDYGVTPLIAHVTSGIGGVTVYPFAEYSQGLAAENEIISQAPTFSYEYCENLCNEVWGDLWKR